MVTTVDCPTCGLRVEWSPSSVYRPFCSERCKLIDLGAWAAEDYSISGTSTETPDDEPDDTRH